MKTTTITTTLAFSVILGLLLFSMILNAQIKINERIEINPTSKIFKSLDASGSSQKLIHLEFSAETDHLVRIATSELVVYGQGGVTADVCQGGSIYLQVSCFEYAQAVKVGFHFKASIDSHVLENFDGVMNLGPGDGFYGWYIEISVGRAILNYSRLSNMCDNMVTQMINLSPNGQNASDCSVDQYLPAYDKVSLSIIRGKELGGFSLDGESIDGISESFLALKINICGTS
jgi:hypothetical protein